MEGFVYDIEADNLYLQSTKIWYIYFKSLDGTLELECWPYKERKEETADKIRNFLIKFEDGCIVAGHNINGYDNWMLWRHLGLSFYLGKDGSDWLSGKKVQFVDTLTLSMFTDSDRPSHSLASYGKELENEKLDFHDFSQYTEEMRIYCKQDVNLNIEVFYELWGKCSVMYKEWIHPSFKMMQKDHYLYSAQSFTGVKFDIELGKTTVDEIQAEMDLIEKEVLPLLPPRKLKKGEEKHYSFPARPFKKDGSLSASMKNWLVKHEASYDENTNEVEAYKKTYKIEPNKLLDVKLPMEMKDSQDIKDWFISQGWKPTYWNFKRDERGKPERNSKGEVITTTPKIQEMGNICPNLLELDGDLPKKIVKFLSLRNRKSVLEGWLSNWRLDFDGRLSAEITGYTPSMRVRHKTVVNVPKASPKVLYGERYRSFFTAERGFKYNGTDASALENRTLAHYTYKYDGGKFADLVLNGDSHSFNVKYAFFEEEAKSFDIYSKDFNKDDPTFKPLRDKAKTGAYLLAYGGSAKKLAQSLGFSDKVAKDKYDKYWEANEGLGKFKEALEKYWSSKGKKKYIPSINGKNLNCRAKNILVNLAGQSCGAIVMAYSFCLMDMWLGGLQIDSLGRPYYKYKGKIVKRVSAFHDEGSWECEEGIESEVKKLTEKSIVKAGELLNIRVDLEAEGQIGTNWKEVH